MWINKMDSELTSAMPSKRIAHEAVCHSNNVNKNMPPLQSIGMPAKKHAMQTPAVTLQ